MQSLIIVSNNKKEREDYAIQVCKKNKVNDFDLVIIEIDKTIGIEEIRNFQKKVFLKPLKGNVKAVLLKADQGLTIEAQNALLKVLEEPPLNTIIILTISNQDHLLPTVRSRCKIVELQQKMDFPEEEKAHYLNLSISLSSSSIARRLKLAQDLAKNKEEALIWLEKMILTIREKMIEDQNNCNCLNLLISLQETYKILSTTNVNPRLTLENLFLNL